MPIHRVEIERGPFKLELSIPGALLVRERVQARYERGLLTVVLPKRGALSA